MKILFIGHILNRDEIPNYPASSVAGNQMQLGYIKSLSKLMEEDIQVISQLPISIFPKSKNILIKKKALNLGNNINALSPSFVNLPFLKSYTLKRNTSRLVKEWLDNYPNDEKVIISFNSTPQIIEPIINCSKKYDIKKVCIFADPPLDFVKRSFFGRLYKNIEFKESKKLIQQFDGIIALNQKIIEDFAPDVPYQIIEGGIDPALFKKDVKPNDNPIQKIIYSGALTEYSGCRNLVDSLIYIKEEDFVIEVYGSGPLEGYIKNYSKNDTRVIYKGVLPHHEMIQREKSADFLINPRMIDDPISTYTFPSKILEYLSTGTPTLSTKMNGLTEYYLSHLNIIDSKSPILLAQSLESILSTDYTVLKDKALNAKKEVLKDKSWIKQTEKLLAFVKSLESRIESI